MFARRRQQHSKVRGVELCESRGQVCTPAGGAEARLDRIRTEVWYQAGLRR